MSVASPSVRSEEVGVAVVVARPGAPAPDLADLRLHGADRLAAYKLPEEIRFVAALPLPAGDKVDRRALAADVATGPPA
mgnify:CR=1 FL=1